MVYIGLKYRKETMVTEHISIVIILYGIYNETTILVESCACLVPVYHIPLECVWGMLCQCPRRNTFM